MSSSISTITSKGQVTIPIEIRQYLGVKPADRVVFIVDAAGKVELRPAPHTVSSIRGIVPALSGREAGDFEAQIEEAAEEAAEHARGGKVFR